MKPKISYILWFSQRTGSTLLCKILEATRSLPTLAKTADDVSEEWIQRFGTERQRD